MTVITCKIQIYCCIKVIYKPKSHGFLLQAECGRELEGESPISVGKW